MQKPDQKVGIIFIPTLLFLLTQFVIFEFKDDNDLSISFRSEVKGGKVVQGMLQFGDQDEDKAKRYWMTY